MNTTSLRLRPLAAAILCSLIAPALFAQTAMTTPVGFITRTIPKAVDAATPSNTTLSIPLYATAAYVSAVASIDSATQLTLSGAAWTAGQFVLAASGGTATTPYLVRVKTGTNVGRFWLVSANTTNQLTVVNPYGGVTNISGLVSVNDSCEILPANTLASVFGAPSVIQSGATSDVADNVLLWNGTNWDTYYYNGTNWTAGGRTSYNNLVIYPDEGVFVIRRATASDATITLMGTVPSTDEKTAIAGSGASTFFANRFPTDTTLGGLGLQNSAGWTPGATADVADDVFIWNGTNWDTYYYNGTNWTAGGRGDKGPTPITAGTAVFVKRVGSGLVTLAQVLPYTP